MRAAFSISAGNFKHSSSCSQKGAIKSNVSTEPSFPQPVVQRISFITDIEGDAAYFDRFIQTSRILNFEPAIPNFDDTLPLDFFPYDKQVAFTKSNNDDDSSSSINEETVLVCGGDIWDKGGSDLYVARQLLSLQNRYGGERVYFVLGNRDLNKMRILQEIGMKDDSDRDLPPHGGLYWFKGTGRIGDPDLIGKLNEASMNNDDSVVSLSSNDADSQIPNTAAERLMWILQKTMGSPDAFELRRGELQREKVLCMEAKIGNTFDSSKIDTSVSDEEVVKSYRISCHPSHGVMGQYLRKGKLAVKIGGTVFFHGCLPVSNELLSRYTTLSNAGNSAFWAEYFQYAMPWLDNLEKYETSDQKTTLAKKSEEIMVVTVPLRIRKSISGIICYIQRLWEGAAVDKESFGKKDCSANVNKDDSKPSSFWSKLFKFPHQITHLLNKSEGNKERGNGKNHSDDPTECIVEENYTELYDEQRRIIFNNMEKKGKKSESDRQNKKIQNAVDWIDTLNLFAKQQSETWAQFVENPDEEYCWSTIGGYLKFGSLMQYGMGSLPNKEKNPTIVYNTWMTNGMPRIICGKDELDKVYASMVGDFFQINDLDLIVTGHQPIGDIPFTIQLQCKYAGKPKYIICGDTSYSGDTIWVGSESEINCKRDNLGRGEALSGRGDVAITEILIDQCQSGKVVGVTYHGKLCDGSDYDSVLLRGFNKDSALVGKLVERSQFIFDTSTQESLNEDTDWFIKAQLTDDTFLVSTGKGYQVFNTIARKRRGSV